MSFDKPVAIQPTSATSNAPFRTIRRYPFYFAIPIVVGLLAGGLLGNARTPTYTAQAQVLVGSIDTNAQSVPGIVAANQSVAATYSRLIGTPVIASIVRDTEARGNYHNNGVVSASPIPQSPIILVEAKSTSEKQALGLATDTTAALRTYIQTLNSGGSDAAGLLQSYNAAANDLATATRNSEAAKANSRSNNADLDAAQAAVDTAKLKVDALAAQYQQRLTGAQGGAAQAQIIAQATLAGDDKKKKLELLLAAGGISGLLFGLALASYVATRERAVVVETVASHSITAS